MTDHEWVSKTGRPWSLRVRDDYCRDCGGTPDSHPSAETIARQTLIAAIRERDEKATLCAKCLTVSGGYHDFTAEACRASKRGTPCGDPDAHHPFEPGEFPEYMYAERDRRTLLALIGSRNGSREA